MSTAKTGRTQEHDLDVIQSKASTMNLRVPTELLRRLKAAASLRGVTLEEFVQPALEHSIDGFTLVDHQRTA